LRGIYTLYINYKEECVNSRLGNNKYEALSQVLNAVVTTTL